MAEHCRWCGHELPPGDVSYCDLHTEVVALRHLRDRAALIYDGEDALDVRDAAKQLQKAKSLEDA
jgi:hypothetical protein